ncbi:hypothetical protein SteCoe_10641 [Stentor coeruleus]|uniref:Uncharacterized protein n=1 Tax=Stentor coeruleus TaxID=5963 RepID=A0A1R2CF47_9CILI|nr:hypothetical protein SteCoe_10641 [Stentor coeruleus]
MRFHPNPLSKNKIAYKPPLTTREAPELSSPRFSEKILSTFSYKILPLVSGKVLSPSSDSKSIENFDDFLNNCSELRRQVTKASQKINSKFIDRTLTKKFYKEGKETIRNKDYFKGALKIEEKLRQKSCEDPHETNENIKNAVEISMATNLQRILSPENVSSKQTIEFLNSNKRGFGSLEVIGSKKKSKYKVKNTQIKINFDKNNLESLKCLDTINENRGNTVANYRNRSCFFEGDKGEYDFISVMKKVNTGRKNEMNSQLPTLKLATMIARKAKMDANQLFTSSKRVDRVIRKKLKG